MYAEWWRQLIVGLDGVYTPEYLRQTPNQVCEVVECGTRLVVSENDITIDGLCLDITYIHKVCSDTPWS